MKPKTLLFCTSYFNDQRQWESRYERWLKHHSEIPWSVDAIALIDDGSPFQPSTTSVNMIEASALGKLPLPRRALVRFSDNLGRPSTLRYPGWWRSFQLALDLAEIYGFEKIVHVESDSYLLSNRILEFIESIETGWTLFWSPHFKWPETAIQVICKDAFPAFAAIRAKGPYGLGDLPAEQVLPYTYVAKTFVGDRYSDFGVAVPADADYAVQVLSDMAISTPTGPRSSNPVLDSGGEISVVAQNVRSHLSSSSAAPDDIVEMRERGMVAYRRGDFNAATNMLHAAIQLGAEDADTLKFLAAALMQTQRVREAIDFGNRAAALAPGDAGLANMLGAFYASVNDADRALSEWSRAIRLDPTDVTPLSNMQATESRLGLNHDTSTGPR